MALRSTRRRLLGLLTVVLFSISSMAHVYAMTHAAMKMPAPMSEMSPQGHDRGCGGDDTLARADCMAICATAIAVPCEPLHVSFFAAVRDADADAPLPLAGRRMPPEPHPPKRFA